MYYVDSQKTTTRRDSSLIFSRKLSQADDDRTEIEILSTVCAPSIVRTKTESATSLVCRPRISVQKELVTAMFESMLSSIVESWNIITSKKPEQNTNIASGKISSELTFTPKRKKSVAKPFKTKKSHSKLELEGIQPDRLNQSWWCGTDERAIIRFRNGNIYEGNICMKSMHGEGRFQWADGTVYMGRFKDNEINGKGTLQWKDDTWYEGDFVSNVRHGKGLYVDSRKQRAYVGGWYCGTKHGDGVIYYSENFSNSYDGQWIKNVRHGYGSREYCEYSGYKGEWDKYVRDGKGLMIWPNHDLYRGEWKNGLMSGYGIYIWNAYYNNSMSLPSINVYRGLWEKGQRNGYGLLNLGLGLGSHYKGDFSNNKKHGTGMFVTNNGLILKSKKLFIDDNIGVIATEENGDKTACIDAKLCEIREPYKFDICDNTVCLQYHIEKAIANIDRQTETRTQILNEYFENNKDIFSNMSRSVQKQETLETTSVLADFEDMIGYEENSLRKSIRNYENYLKVIYHKYATICNTEEIHFTPVLIRLYLWQFYYDCDMHKKGLTLVEIDEISHENPEWLTKTPHNPFEKIYYWQFLHSLISVARKLYAIRQMPSKKPDTILASAFTYFMERDVLCVTGRCKGHLTNGYGTFIPLKGTYQLYRTLGEPHTVRTFMCAVRRSPHNLEQAQPVLFDVFFDYLRLGHNVYVFGDEMAFVSDMYVQIKRDDTNQYNDLNHLKLYMFDNLSNKTIVNLFSRMFPLLDENKRIINLDVEITFFEFFEAFVQCAEESIRLKQEDLRWSEKKSASETIPLYSPYGAKPK